MAFPVILGVNAPQYTEEELRAFREENEKGVTYEGRHYTGYEATQMQRKVERSIRRQKRRVVASETSGDVEQLTVDQIRLQRINQEYTRFSHAVGLRTERERAQIADFGPASAAQAVGTTSRFDAFTARLVGTRTKTGVIIQDASPHAFGQMQARGVSENAVFEALTTPLKHGIIRADRSQQFIGEHATVAINVDTGKVITVWPTSAKKAKKLKENRRSSS